MDAAGVWAQETVGEFKENTLADARGAEKDSGFIRGDGEAYIFEDGRAVEGNRNIAETEGQGLVRRATRCRLAQGGWMWWSQSSAEECEHDLGEEEVDEDDEHR